MLERNGGLGAGACVYEQFRRAYERFPPVCSVLAYSDADNDVLQHEVFGPLRRNALCIFTLGNYRTVPAGSGKGFFEAYEKGRNGKRRKEHFQHRQFHLMRIDPAGLYSVLSWQPFIDFDKGIFLGIHQRSGSVGHYLYPVHRGRDSSYRGHTLEDRKEGSAFYCFADRAHDNPHLQDHRSKRLLYEKLNGGKVRTLHPSCALSKGPL